MPQVTGLHVAIGTQLTDDKYADLTISCGSHVFKAHKAVLCPQSPFFKAACDSGFKESRTGTIQLPDDDPSILKRFLEFIYTGTYKDGIYITNGRVAKASAMNLDQVDEILKTERTTGNIECLASVGTEDGHSVDFGTVTAKTKKSDQCQSLFTSLGVYVMADKFQVPQLKLLAYYRFFKMMKRALKTYKDFQDLPDLLCKVYEMTAPTDQIRQIPCILMAARGGLDACLKKTIEPVVRKHPDLAMDIIRHKDIVLANPPECISCKNGNIAPSKRKR